MITVVNLGLRVVGAGVCVVAIWSSWNLARADHLFREDNVPSIRSAIRLEPDAALYYLRVAQLDESSAMSSLKESLRFDPYNAEADIELGLRYESEGNYNVAEGLMLKAFSIDHTFVPRWTLANFYFRRDNDAAFWIWARRAAEMPSDNVGPLFELCWHESPDWQKISNTILTDNPALIGQYLGFLLRKQEYPAAAVMAQRLIAHGDKQTDAPKLFDVINLMVGTRNADEAKTVWNALEAQRWIPADAGVPYNPSFARVPLPASFDWGFPPNPGIHSRTGPSGLRTEFDGRQSEDCVIAYQVVVLPPGDYRAEYSYHTADIEPQTGLHFQVVDLKSNVTLATSQDLSSNQQQNGSFSFTVPPEDKLLYYRLAYRRALGTTRISGSSVITSTHILHGGRNDLPQVQ